MSSRNEVTLSSFGFLRRGVLSVNVSNFTTYVKNPEQHIKKSTFLLVLMQQKKQAEVHIGSKAEECNFMETDSCNYVTSCQSLFVSIACFTLPAAAVYFWIRPDSDRIAIIRSTAMKPLHLVPYINMQNHSSVTYDVNHTLNDLTRAKTSGRPFEFSMTVDDDAFVGFYTLSLHKCNYSSHVFFDLVARIEENNDGNYLSAGNMGAPTMCFILSVIFFGLGVFWLYILKRSEGVYKMHYLMLAVVWVKCLSLLFHGINLFYVSREGQHKEAWAIVYYVAYLMKESLLFVTIILIGSGWAFIKDVLTQREKKLFIIFIPLQVLDNVAYIIMKESEVTYRDYVTWKRVFVIVDLICCIVILLPIYWSIRHLQQAAGPDGKSAHKHNKLKLFKHFCIIVVAYIYFTRIIKVLLMMFLPFYMTWVAELLREIAIFTFFILTGSKFRPASDNPYLMVPEDDDDDDDDDEDIEMDTVIVGKSGVLETVVKLPNREGEMVVAKRESSHDYD